MSFYPFPTLSIPSSYIHTFVWHSCLSGPRASVWPSRLFWPSRLCPAFTPQRPPRLSLSPFYALEPPPGPRACMALAPTPGYHALSLLSRSLLPSFLPSCSPLAIVLLPTCSLTLPSCISSVLWPSRHTPRRNHAYSGPRATPPTSPSCFLAIMPLPTCPNLPTSVTFRP